MAGSRGGWIAGVVAALALGFGAAWLLFRQPASPPPPRPKAQLTPAVLPQFKPPVAAPEPARAPEPVRPPPPAPPAEVVPPAPPPPKPRPVAPASFRAGQV